MSTVKLSIELRKELSALSSMEAYYGGLYVAKQAMTDLMTGYETAFKADTELDEPEKLFHETRIDGMHSAMGPVIRELAYAAFNLPDGTGVQDLFDRFIAERKGPPTPGPKATNTNPREPDA